MRLGCAIGWPSRRPTRDRCPPSEEQHLTYFSGCALRAVEATFWWAGGSESVFRSLGCLARLVPPYRNRAEQDWGSGVFFGHTGKPRIVRTTEKDSRPLSPG